jgi:hypothetical protein
VYYCCNHRRYHCRHNAANSWYYVPVFCFGRKLNRADCKNSFMTVTRIQKQFNFNCFNFRISKAIVWASFFNTHPFKWFRVPRDTSSLWNTCPCWSCWSFHSTKIQVVGPQSPVTSIISQRCQLRQIGLSGNSYTWVVLVAGLSADLITDQTRT